jgi:hypothetical protein
MPSSTVRIDDDLKLVVQGFSPNGSFSDAIREILRERDDYHYKYDQVNSSLSNAQTTINSLQNVTATTSSAPAGAGVSFAVPETMGGMTATYWTEFDSRMKKHTDNLLEQARRGY